MTNLSIVSIILASTSLVLIGVSWLRGEDRKWRRRFAFLAVAAYAAVLSVRPDSLVLSNTGLILASVGLAPLLARGLGNTGAIAAFAITASLVDLLSFGGGLTRRIIQDYNSGSSDLLQFLALTVPLEGRATPLIGVVDLLIAGAMFLALVEIHGSNTRAVLVLLSALALAVVVGLIVGGVAAVPFVGLAAAADAWRARRRGAVARTSRSSFWRSGREG
jgi:hypothetical protein